MALLHFPGDATVLIRRKTLGVAILFRITRADPGPFPKRFVLHDSRNDHRLRAELDISWRNVGRHHANQIVIIQETVEKADERYADVSRSLEPHMRGVEKHDKRTSGIGCMPQALDFLRCAVFDD